MIILTKGDKDLIPYQPFDSDPFLKVIAGNFISIEE